MNRVNRVNTIISVVKSNLNEYNFIEIDFEIINDKLIINIYPRYEFIEINDKMFKLINIIETELVDNRQYAAFRKDYQINTYKTLNNYINR